MNSDIQKIQTLSDNEESNESNNEWGPVSNIDEDWDGTVLIQRAIFYPTDDELKLAEQKVQEKKYENTLKQHELRLVAQDRLINKLENNNQLLHIKLDDMKKDYDNIELKNKNLLFKLMYIEQAYEKLRASNNKTISELKTELERLKNEQQNNEDNV